MSFKEECYKVLRKVPAGKVTTYKELAKALNTKAYRAVGTAMKTNPYAPEVPCHRVIKSDGSIGDFNGGINKKISLLEHEGVQINDNKVDLKKYLHKF